MHLWPITENVPLGQVYGGQYGYWGVVLVEEVAGWDLGSSLLCPFSCLIFLPEGKLVECMDLVKQIHLEIYRSTGGCAGGYRGPSCADGGST